jgi:hypothetical protein
MRSRCFWFASQTAATMFCSTPYSRLNWTIDAVSFGKQDPP